MQKTYLDGNIIEITPFDLKCTGAVYKLDLLYYNTINRYGEILKSLVYNSGPRSADDVSNIEYNPSKLFLNSDFELEYNLKETSNKWKNNTLQLSDIKLLKDNSYSAIHKYDRYDIKTSFAPEYINGAYAYDGWYSLVSIALPKYDANEIVTSLDIRYNETSNRAVYMSPDLVTWLDLATDILYEEPIYDLSLHSASNYNKSYDFLVIIKTLALYKTLLNKTLDSEWFTRLNALAPKLRTLEAAAEQHRYDLAQHMINSVNWSIMLLLI